MNCPDFKTEFDTEEKLIQYIRANKDLDIIKNDCSILLFACMKKYERAVLRILQKPPNTIQLSHVYKDKTALLVACKNRMLDVVDRLLDFDSNDIF